MSVGYARVQSDTLQKTGNICCFRQDEVKSCFEVLGDEPQPSDFQTDAVTTRPWLLKLTCANIVK